MEKFELVFIPSPGLSHLIATVQTAKLLLDLDSRLSITILTMQLPTDTTVDAYTAKISASRLTFIPLPIPPTGPRSREPPSSTSSTARSQTSDIIEQRNGDIPIAGVVLDMFCLAREFGFPAYCLFTSGACPLGLFL